MRANAQRLRQLTLFAMVVVALTPATGAVSSEGEKRLERIYRAKIPPVTAPILFDTPDADAMLAALEGLPPDSAWYQVITDWPVHADPKRIVESIGAKKPLRCNAG